MKKLLYQVSSVLFFMLLLPSLSFAQPRIVFNEEVVDFKEVIQGEEVEHTFAFENAGDQDLVIEKVSSS